MAILAVVARRVTVSAAAAAQVAPVVPMPGVSLTRFKVGSREETVRQVPKAAVALMAIALMLHGTVVVGRPSRTP